MKSQFVMLFSATLLAAAAGFTAHLFVRVETVRLGLELSKEQKSLQAMSEQRSLLSLEAATLRQVDRVETVGRSAFGMQIATPADVIPVEHSAAPRISGRAQ